ncbi:hypothetical protein RNJ44_01789 [Nakaseomyces bracarensis]|uniref:Protein kinase domain-containing protein n=1 Tax=Nakaseomyces bracarensis TaxID=273131 RepID=A0ABR4NNV1_9SACH
MIGNRHTESGKSDKFSESSRDTNNNEQTIQRSRNIDCPGRRRESSEGEQSLYFQPKKIYRLEQERASRSTLVKDEKPYSDADAEEMYSIPKVDSTSHIDRYMDRNYQYSHINGLVPNYTEAVKKNRAALSKDNEDAKNNYDFKTNINFASEMSIDESGIDEQELHDMHDEYIPNLNYDELIEKWKDADNDRKEINNLEELHRTESLYERDMMKEASQILSSKSRPNNSLNKFVSWNDEFENESQSLTQRPSVTIPEVSSDDDAMIEGSLSPNTSAIFKTSHAQVEPIPLPRHKSIKTPPSTLEMDRRMSYLNFIGKGTTFGTIDNSTLGGTVKSISGLLPLNRSSLPVVSQMRKKSSGQSTGDSDSSSMQLQGNLSPSIGDLRMDAEQMIDIVRKLPSDYMTLPYSKRKKIINDLVPDRDTRLVMTVLKKFMLTNSKSSSSVQKQGGRSRHGSVASQFLSSFSPSVSSMVSGGGGFKPDDKGLLIMGHKLGKVIGFGAWGMIRECVDVQSGANRAMKIVRFKSNQKVKRNVIREVGIWEELHHMYILPLLDWKLVTDYAMYCLTERVKDGTLYDLVLHWEDHRSNHITVEERVKLTIFLMLQLLSALNYMHSKSIVHGDVKLENCLLKKGKSHKNWTISVCDFGMSCHYGSVKNRYDAVIDDSGSDMNISRQGSQDVLTFEASPRPMIPNLSKDSLYTTISNSSGGSQPASKLMKIITNKKYVHDDTAVEVTPGSTKRAYGPAITSARMSTLSTASLESLPSSPSAMGLEKIHQFNPTSADQRRHISMSGESHVEPIQSSQIGSLPYASPELLSPDPSPLGPGADIWALGVTMYTMLVGKLPFKHDLESKLRQLIISGKFDRKALRYVCNNGDDRINKDELIYQGLYNAILGCLNTDVLERWSLKTVEIALRRDFENNGGLN